MSDPSTLPPRDPDKTVDQPNVPATLPPCDIAEMLPPKSSAAMRAQSVADEVPATVLSLYVSKAKLSRWMFAGGLVGMILGYALVPTDSFEPFIYCLAGAGVAACIVANVRGKTSPHAGEAARQS